MEERLHEAAADVCEPAFWLPRPLAVQERGANAEPGADGPPDDFLPNGPSDGSPDINAYASTDENTNPRADATKQWRRQLRRYLLSWLAPLRGLVSASS